MKTESCIHVVMMLLPLLLMQGLGSSCIDSERDALLELKKGFIDKSDRLSSWSGEKCCHNWVGVDCDGVGHVVNLTISFLTLGGEINPSLLNLEYLQSLDLMGNMFSGMLPSNIGSLKNLTHIYLFRNNFTGPIPPSIGLLSNLQSLDASENHFTGPIPPSIGLLSNLSVLDVTQNNLTGPIPTSIGLLSNLEVLLVSQNDLTGSIPTNIGLLSNLVFLDVSFNSLSGIVSELHFAKLASLEYLDMDSKKLTMNISHQWVPPFQLQYLRIQSCKVGPEFPSWLQTQTSLIMLNLSSTGISDTLPGWFEGLLSNIWGLDLSKNEIRGKVPEFKAVDMHVNLRFNRFETLFQQFPSGTGHIDVSNNLLSGQFPPNNNLSGNGSRTFIFANNNLSGPIPDYFCSLNPNVVDLSSNQLSGELNSCFGYSKTLLVLDLSNNSLHGQIPSDFGYGSVKLPLFSLHLSNNRFHGKLSSTLQNFNNLRTLDLSKNAFTDFLPHWLSNLTNLSIVNLQSNNLYGEIPETLCKLKHLKLLHIGQNRITGKLPPCFSNFTAMTTNDSLGNPIVRINGNYIDFRDRFQENLEVVIRGLNQRYTSSLPFLISMDLSSNNIVGNIPSELTNLVELKNLNLSGNHMQGSIPMRIGNLRNLESLDLSRNKLSGPIPSSLSSLNFLSHLNLSFNNLSGRIPTGNQLQTLPDPSIYMGNDNLCGKPLGGVWFGRKKMKEWNGQWKRNWKGIGKEWNGNEKSQTSCLVAKEWNEIPSIIMFGLNIQIIGME